METFSNSTDIGNKAEELKSTLYIWITPYVWVMSPDMQRQGSRSAIIARTVRRIPPGAFAPTVRNLQWGDFTRRLIEAGDPGAVYPLLTDGDGNLTEGPGYKICIFKNGVLYTADRGVLDGITREYVIEASTKKGVGVRVEVGVSGRRDFLCVPQLEALCRSQSWMHIGQLIWTTS